MNSIQHDSVQNTLWGFENALAQFQYSQTVNKKVVASPFGDILTKLTRERVGKQWRALSYLWSKYETGLKYSREGKLHNAEQIFAEAASLHSEFKQTPLLNQLANVGALPAIAYLQYKQALYKEAESSLITSIDSDATLLTEGLYILDYHRVQQLHNLARLYFKQSRLEEGAYMIHKALRFMLCGDPLSLGSSTGSVITTEEIPVELRSDMLYQLTGETASVFLNYPEINTELCQFAFSELTEWESRTEDEHFHRQFFTLQQAYMDRDFDLFMEKSHLFLTRSPKQFDSYKLSILMNMINCINHCNGYTDSMKRVIMEFIQKLHVREQQKETCLTFFHQLTENSTQLY